MKELFANLMKITEDTDSAFYFKDFNSVGGGLYRIFAYRLANYTGFLQPDALECRGTMFEIDAAGNPIRIAARTPQKFFNAYENPLAMYDKDMLASEIVVSMDKRDGSIISTFRDNDGVLRTKSHGSLHSEHAQNSTAMIQADDVLKENIDIADKAGYTVNLEYTSPEYRIVLPYQKDELVVLNLRHRDTGKLLLGEELKDTFPVLYARSVFEGCGDIHPTTPVRVLLSEVIDDIRKMTDIEGYVLILKDGRTCKVKTDWYCALHFTKDSITVDSRLYEAVLEGASDDLRQMFSTDPYSINKIEKMEQLVFMCYNKLVSDVESFYDANKHLDRKAYALSVQSTLPNELGMPGLAFNLYNGKTVDYKGMMQKYMQDVLKGF